MKSFGGLKMYKTFMSHAEKVTNSPALETRPVLQGVKHFENGDLAVTDSHRLYFAKEIHDKGETVLSPKGKKVEGNYPDIKRLLSFSSNDPKFKLTFELNELIKGVDIILTAAKVTNESPIMSYAENVLFFDSEEVKASYELPHSIEGMYPLSNAQYWMDALRLFKAFKYTEIELSIYGEMRPFTLVGPDEKLTALLLPIRRY